MSGDMAVPAPFPCLSAPGSLADLWCIFVRFAPDWLSRASHEMAPMGGYHERHERTSLHMYAPILHMIFSSNTKLKIYLNGKSDGAQKTEIHCQKQQAQLEYLGIP